MTEEMEYICFQLIANSGAAKSSFIEAIQLAKAGNLKEAKIKVEEAEDSLVEAHKIHSNLIQIGTLSFPSVFINDGYIVGTSKSWTK